MEATPSHVNGRFTVGNRAGVGHSAGKGRRASSRAWVDAIRAETTPERWREIILHALDSAAGRVEGVDAKAAREWLSRYVADPSRSNDGGDVLLGGTW